MDTAVPFGCCHGLYEESVATYAAAVLEERLQETSIVFSTVFGPPPSGATDRPAYLICSTSTGHIR
eukprot:3895296-Pyramimonas_sp.AAC.2